MQIGDLGPSITYLTLLLYYQLSTFVWGCFKLIKLKPIPFQVGTKLPLPFSLYLSHDVCSESEDIEGEKGEEATVDIQVSG